jgi:hypothetical protein
MLELIQSVHAFAGIFILAVLILLIFDPLGLSSPKAPRQNDRRGRSALRPFAS